MLHSDRSHSVNYYVLSLPNWSVMVLGPWPRWESEQSEAFWSPLYMHVCIQARIKHPKILCFYSSERLSPNDHNIKQYILIFICVSASVPQKWVESYTLVKMSVEGRKTQLHTSGYAQHHSWMWSVCCSVRTSVCASEHQLSPDYQTMWSCSLKCLYCVFMSAIVRKRDTRTGGCRSLRMIMIIRMMISVMTVADSEPVCISTAGAPPLAKL